MHPSTDDATTRTPRAQHGPRRVMDSPAADLGAPWLPPGRSIDLPGVGTTFVRDSGGPAGAPVVLLLHGWAVTADLNWFTAYPALAERYRVLALDHRGHGRGVRPANGIVRLPDCADDAVAVLDVLGIERATVVGYSMGGAVAQLVWRRHPERVAGLVLGSTARHFQGGPVTDLWYRSYTPLAHAAHRVSGPADALVRWRVDRRVKESERAAWMRSELERVSPAGLLSSMRSIGRFRSNSWIGDVDVPAAIIVTTKDRTVPTRNQRRLAAAIPGAAAYEVVGPHDSIITRAEAYIPVLGDALEHATAT
ncbi:alpha/beta fold hydrolase [Aquihabitans daechungensis]|uniref:alpha/beta fold hydrolase n=1 Tax=Aquihabitans daechungensis TaxID=1052257 RepID=UPI003B9FC8B9